eukprot:SAG11_NODE_4396_length_1913_cov_5.546223_4_plen_24_part_01
MSAAFPAIHAKLLKRALEMGCKGM